MAASSNGLPLQRFIETLQNLRRSHWLDRLRHHHPHQPTRAFVEEFIRISTRLLSYIRRHHLLPDFSSSSPMRRQSARSSRESLHVRRVHREQVFGMLVRLHQYIDTLRRIVHHGFQHHLSSDNHRHCIDALHVFTNFHAARR